MTRYLIDTSILIDVSMAHTPVRAWVASFVATGDVLGTCGIVVAEFSTGVTPRHYAIWAQVSGTPGDRSIVDRMIGQHMKAYA